MQEFYVYHVVTERPMELNQIIVFDESHHSGVYERVMAKKELVEKIYENPNKYLELEHHTKVALRELALEKVRQDKYPDYPSRLASLYVSTRLEDAISWADFFQSLGRPVYQLVKLKVIGNSFTGDAHNCFDGTTNENTNLELAHHYWENLPNKKNAEPLMETIVNGTIEVIEIIKVYQEENYKKI